MNPLLLQLMTEIKKSEKARFVSFTYRTKKTNELARYTVLLGVNVQRVYEKDLAKLLILETRLDGVKKLACRAIIDSLKNSLSKGIGKNDNYTCKDTFEHVSKDLKFHKENKQIYVSGFLRRKTTIEKGEFKEVNSSEETLIKKSIEKYLSKSKMRSFILSSENFQSVRLNGKTLEFS